MDLDSLRCEIDQIDRELLALYLRRMEIVRQVAGYKLQNDLPVFHPKREAEILERVRQDAGLESDEACRFFQSILDHSKAVQQKMIDEAKGSGR